MRHVSRTHRVALDWLFDRINLDPKIQLKYIDTPTTNSQTSWPKGISHVMSGIICWLCLTSAISALQFAPLRWQNELNKNQEKNVSQPNHDLWWIWQRGCLRSCRLQLHQTRGGPRVDIKILENLLQTTIDRETWETVTTRLFKRGLWSILVFSRVEKWSCGARSIRETWDNFLGYIAKSWPSSWGTSSRQECAFCKVRRADSWWIGETRVSASPRTGLSWWTA